MSSYIEEDSSLRTTVSRLKTLKVTVPFPKTMETMSPTLSLTEGLAGLPFTVTRPAWQTSLATVLLLMTRETLRNLSSLIKSVFILSIS